MTTHVSLNDLSLEADERVFEEILPEGPYETQTMEEITIELEAAQKIFDLHTGLLQRRTVCRADMERVQELAGSFPSLEKLLNRYPINSFSVESSSINFTVSNESFIKTAYEAVVRAVREVLKFIVEAFSRLFKYMTSNAQRTAAVDDLRPKLADLQSYIFEVDRCMAGSSISAEYSKFRKGALESARHNASKKWNGLRNYVIFSSGDAFAMAETFAGALKVGVPPFVDAVDKFLGDLSNAQTDADIQVAVAQMSMYSASSGPLMALANAHGYSATRIARAPSVTPFQGMTLWFRDMFRSWTNDRTDITSEQFDSIVLNGEVAAWAPMINEVIRTGSSRTAQIVKRINAFNEHSLKPGLEDAYANELAPFFKALLSITQGFSTLENCLGTLTGGRDGATIEIAQAALAIVKTIDGFVKKHQDALTIGARSTINLRRKQLAQSIGQ